MSVEAPLKVVICWHMHQPNYYAPGRGHYCLPWTYLHATKDYVDMVALLEANPQARAVVNFAPILLEQIDDYVRQLRDWHDKQAPIKDPLLAALAAAVMPAAEHERLAIAHQCIRVNHDHLVKPFSEYERLVKLVQQLEEEPQLFMYLGDQFLVDLLVWYHLAWLGETVHQNDLRVSRLVKKGCGFSLHDRHELLGIIDELLSNVIARYRVLAEHGQIELSMNPYAHPIVPLMLDMQSAREAWPDVLLPEEGQYPGGEERARWHMQQGIKVFEQFFGHRPAGCWPSEGGLSTATVKLFDEFGMRWAASGESVLRNSLFQAGRVKEIDSQQALYRPYRIACSQAACFFRDDGLSDLIGFTYSDWHGDDAAGNLVKQLEHIARHTPARGERVVSIILDGENAWEHYPHNGHFFLSALYEGIAEHPLLEMTTFSDVLDAGMPVDALEEIVAGSWVYGTFSTWVGNRDKNAGWNLLIEAKRSFDEVVASGKLKPEQLRLAEQQLAVCEGSDWFWWFGDYNPAETVSDFEHLFRTHLAHLYRLLGIEAPESLSHEVSHGSGTPEHGGAMRRGH
ncbi:MAG: glycoside hydrolase family 57 protein [Granulosicoccaceae bacterium]|jgi:alpha-amylase/alpha-mannosidase (GH57 family)